jgi:hypothetical protein
VLEVLEEVGLQDAAAWQTNAERVDGLVVDPDFEVEMGPG